MELPTISNEQHNIIELLKNNNNLIVESVAGSGKTTSNLFIAKSFPNYNILLLTYNAKLKLETREKILKLEIKNLETHSYHSFCVKYYDNKCYTDTKIKKIINSKINLKQQTNYDLIILDESQDITPLYYELICKILKDNIKKAQLCLLGDRYQNIYDFNNADSRYMIHADKLFNFNDLNWSRCKLSESYRITNKMSNFINCCLMNTEHIKSNKESKYKPNYIICNTFCDKRYKSEPLKELYRYLDLGYKPEEIFILAPSVKNEKCPVRVLENLIKQNSSRPISVYVPVSDEEKLDVDVLKGKLVFSTFHQSKGLERKVVIIYSFDNSYFDFFKKDKDSKVCPNEIYVASSRALEHLTLFHHETHEYFKFININKLKIFCNYYGCNSKIQKNQICENYDTSVTDLIRHLPAEVIDNCLDFLKIENIKNPTTNIKIDTKIKNEIDDSYESVSEITGIAIPSYFEYKTTKKMTIYDRLKQNKDKFENLNLDINLDNITENELLYISNYYSSSQSGYLFKTYQIGNYDWLSKENLLLALKNFETLNISNDAKYEEYIEIENDKDFSIPELSNRRIIGSIDCIDNNNIYEFKCVGKLEKVHILQLAVYMFLYKSNEIKNKNDNKLKLEKYENNNKLVNKKIQINNKNIKTSNDLLLIEKLNNNNLLLLERIKIREKKIESLNNLSSSIYSVPSYLYNILTDELIKISCDNYNELKSMMGYLIDSKYKNIIHISDNDFINNNILILNKYLDNIINSEIINSEIINSEIINNVVNSDRILLDIETDGTDNIIQVAYKIYDNNMEILDKKNIYINDGIHFSDYYNRISKSTIINKGITPKEASKILYDDISNTNILVGHNVKLFDYEKIKKYITKYYGKNITKELIFHDTCTNEIIKNKVGAKDKNNRIKMPKLEELYKFLFPNEIINNNSTHTADYDVDITEKCYKKIQSEYKLFL
jgi:hypothetical protein